MITFKFLMANYDYEWKCQKEENKDMIIFSNNYIDFTDELKKYGEYDLYIQDKIKTPVGEQMTLEDVL